MRFAFTSLAVVAVATLALAQPHARQVRPHFNPTVHDLEVAATSGSAPPVAAPVEANTNAKRFALNLPPLKPRVNHRRPNRSPHAGTPVRAAARAETSPLPPASTKCLVLASYANGTEVGYLSPVWNDFGEYGATQSDPAGALELSFMYSPSSPSQLDLVAINGPNATYSYFAGIVGFASDTDDFSAGSYNYAYLGGTPQSSAGSPPFVNAGNSYSDITAIPADTESAIWSYNSETQAITAQWINSDGSAPATHIVATQGVLAITGDVNEFNEAFGDAFEYLLTCVPPVVSPA